MNIVNIMHIAQNPKYKRIVVSENIYQKLKNLGKAGDSFNDVLIKILEAEQLGEETKNVRI